MASFILQLYFMEILSVTVALMISLLKACAYLPWQRQNVDYDHTIIVARVVLIVFNGNLVAKKHESRIFRPSHALIASVGIKCRNRAVCSKKYV